MENASFRGALMSGGAMAFAGLGDALLYPILPIYGENMGFSTLFIGLLLSVNRFVRIVSNSPIANLVQRHGMRSVTLVSSLIAGATTLVYGMKPGAIIFLLARIAWGLSYAGLKLSTLNYAAGARELSASAFGISKTITTTGALSVLYLGPMLVQAMDVSGSFLLLSLISFTGVLLATNLPTVLEHKQTTQVRAKHTFTPTPINLLTFIFSVAIDGILVVVLAKLLNGHYHENAALLAGVAFYLLLKRLFALMVSAISGFMALRISPRILFDMAGACCCLGILLIAADQLVPGIVITFLFNPLIVTFSPWVVLQIQHPNTSSLQVISGINTWWDLGAAVGAFSGILLHELLGLNYLFLLLFGLTSLAFFNFKFHANTTRTIV